MNHDYIKYFEEFSSQVVFDFFMSERYDIEDVPTEYGYEAPFMTGSHLELDCSFTINNLVIKYGEYEKRLTQLSTSALRSIKHVTYTSPDNIEFFKKIRKTIDSCLGWFVKKDGLLVRTNCSYIDYKESRLPLIVLEEGQALEDSYYKLFSPYIILQYENLINFQKSFEKIYVMENKSTNKSEIQLEPVPNSTFRYIEQDPSERLMNLGNFQITLRNFVDDLPPADFIDIFLGVDKPVNKPLNWTGPSDLIAYFIMKLSKHPKIEVKFHWKAASNCFTFHGMRKSSIFLKGNWKKDERPNRADEIDTALENL